MKVIWLGYPVFVLGNCAMKLCIKIALNATSSSMQEEPKILASST